MVGDVSIDIHGHLQRTGETKDKSYCKEYLYGKASYIKMIEPDIGVSFFINLEEINWDY